MVPRVVTALRLLLRTVGGLAAAGLLVLLGGAAAQAQDEVLVPPSSGSWSVAGHGWGHGIGMSQWGAQGAALKGLSAEQILDFYYPGTVRTDIGQDYPLRVRLLSASGGATVTAGPVPGAAVTVVDGASGVRVTLPVGARAVITRSAGSFTVASLQGTTRTPVTFNGARTVAGAVWLDGGAPGQVWVYQPSGAGSRYVGSIQVNATGAGTAETINHVPMEQYLRGVVPRESPSSWAPAALQAQSVAARSYALSVRAPSGSADLCDTTQCQVYSGSASVTAAGVVTELHAAGTDAAIAATARNARYYGGGPAFTQFSSTNGGFSKAGSRPYLVARPDPYTGTAPGDSRSSWTGTLTVAAVQQSCPAGGTLQRLTLSRDGNGDLGGRIAQARLECSTGVATVATPAFGLYSSWWKATSVGQPFGNLEAVEGTTGGVRVKGWVIDPDTTGALTVTVQYGGSSFTTVARLPRPDVGAAYPAAGPLHGFDVTLPAGAGATTVCVTARNVGQGSDLPFPCTAITVPPGGPYGSLDAAAGVPAVGGATGRATVRGWAVDPDVPTQPIDVEVVVDGATVTRATASEQRPDVGAALPGFGAAHGYTVTVPVGAGRHEVCVRAVNVPSGGSPTLGCSWVTPPGGSPVGTFERATGESGAVRVSGWALDPDTVDPVNPYETVRGSGGYVLANGNRADGGRA
jgi:SpoIID/LytB domain protein